MKKSLFFAIVTIFFFTSSNAQEVAIPEIGIQAPSFSAQSTEGKINFPSDYGKQWKILFSHPKDFTPVCSSEILELAYDQKSFEDMNTQLLIVSTDILEQHKSWKSALEEISFHDRAPVKINFPLVSDNNHQISRKYGMIHSASSTSLNIRGVYFIDPDNVIRAIQFYPSEVGRNIDEVKRALAALQEADGNKNLVMPANWRPGDDALVPVLTKKEKQELGTPQSDYYEVAWFMIYKKMKSTP